jgi:hypothetical protein
MLASGLESYVTVGLEGTLHDIFLEKVSDLFAIKYFFLNIDWVSEVFTLLNFVSGLDSKFVKHLVVTDEGTHHGFKKAAIEHESRLMDEGGHLINDVDRLYKMKLRAMDL